jgi:hypothetical protein
MEGKSKRYLGSNEVFVYVRGSDKPAIIDWECVEILKGYGFYLCDGYVARIERGDNRNGVKHFLHHLIVGKPEGNDQIVAFVSGDRFDCRVANLHFEDSKDAHSWQYGMSGIHPANTSGYKGVHWCKQKGKWLAEHKHKRKRVLQEWYDDPEEAARAYDRALVKYKGPYAKTNKMMGLIDDAT